MSKYGFSSNTVQYSWSDEGLLSFKAAGIEHTTTSHPVFSDAGAQHYRADVFPADDAVDPSGFVIFAAGVNGPKKNDFVVEMYG